MKRSGFILVFLLIFCFSSIGLIGQEKLFWVSGDPDNVMKANLDGSDVEVVTNI